MEDDLLGSSSLPMMQISTYYTWTRENEERRKEKEEKIRRGRNVRGLYKGMTKAREPEAQREMRSETRYAY